MKNLKNPAVFHYFRGANDAQDEPIYTQMEPNMAQDSAKMAKLEPRWRSWGQDRANMAPSWSQDGQVGAKMEPTWSKKGGGPLLHPQPVVHAPPPLLGLLPLVNPLRVLPAMHRTHWASQSFPEQQTSVLSQQQTSASALITQRQHLSHGSSSG